MNERLYRSRDDRVIAGVAGGVAEMLNLDPSLVRILWVILAVLTGGILFLLYIIMMIVVPEEPDDWQPSSARSYGPAAPPSGVGTTAGWNSAAPGGWSATPPPAAPGSPDLASATAAPDEIPASSAPGLSADATTAAFASNPPTAVDTSGAATAPETAPSGAADSTGIPGWNAATPSWNPQGAGTTDWRSSRAAERWARREQRRAWRAERRQHSDGFGAVIFGVLLILVGGFFLLRTYYPSIDTDRFWPVVLVVIGALFIAGSLRRGSGENNQ